MILSVKRVMHIRRCIKVGLRFVVTHRTPKQFAPFERNAFAAKVGEPLAPGATAGTVVACSMRIGFCGDHAERIRFFSRTLIDFAAQLVRLFAVHAPRFASPFGLHLAQALKEQHAAGILCAHIRNATCNLVCSIRVHLAHMLPQLLITVFALDWLARLPLFFCDALEMAEACLIESMIGDKDGFDKFPVLPDGDDGEVFDVEIHRHRHQIWVKLALFDFLRGNLFRLRTVQFRRVLAKYQLRTLLFSSWLDSALLKIAAVLDRVIRPDPSLPGVHLEPDKAFTLIKSVQFEGKRPLIERWMVGGSRQSWLALLPAALVPVRAIRQIRSHLANGHP